MSTVLSVSSASTWLRNLLTVCVCICKLNSSHAAVHVLAEYLSSVEDYLQNSLSTESLSTAAQIKRRHLLDKFYSLRIAPNVRRKSAGNTALRIMTRTNE